MQFERVYSFLLHKLEQELPAHLHYHNAAHTKEVVHAAQVLAKKEGVSAHDLHLLSTAALFHDCGFLQGYDNHEERSCDLARTYLPQYEYSEEQVETVCRLIMVTKMPQNPTDALGRILCDADLAYLGSDQYQQRAEALFQEMRAAGVMKDWKEWQNVQLRFLKAHRYFTATANKEFSPKKLKNLQLFIEQFTHIHEHGHSNKFAETLGDMGLIIVGVISAAFALKGFLVPNHFFDGGVSGISLLLHELYGFNLSVTILVINVPFIIAGLFVVSRRFAVKTLISVILLGICLLVIPYPTITS